MHPSIVYNIYIGVHTLFCFSISTLQCTNSIPEWRIFKIFRTSNSKALWIRRVEGGDDVSDYFTHFKIIILTMTYSVESTQCLLVCSLSSNVYRYERFDPIFIIIIFFFFFFFLIARM